MSGLPRRPPPQKPQLLLAWCDTVLIRGITCRVHHHAMNHLVFERLHSRTTMPLPSTYPFWLARKGGVGRPFTVLRP